MGSPCIYFEVIAESLDATITEILMGPERNSDLHIPECIKFRTILELSIRTGVASN